MFIRNFNMTLAVSGTLKAGAKVQYLCTMVCVEALHHFDALSDEVESSTPETLTSIILGLGTYLPPIYALSKQKRVMRRRIRKLRGLKLIRYAACLVELHKYLSV